MRLRKLSDQHIYVKVSFTKILHLWMPLLLSLYALIYLPPPSPKIVIINIVLVYITVCLGHCVGLHRCIIHQTFNTFEFVKKTLLFFSCLSGIGGSLNWIKVHALRDHWQNQGYAPSALTYKNSLIYDFFINLHCRIYPKDPLHVERLPQGLIRNSTVLFFEKAWVFLNLFLFLLLWRFTSLSNAIFLVPFRVSISIVGHWLVGYIVHKWGYKTYNIKGAIEEGRNSLILGWLTFGEAYHNNHHKFPDSASMGLKRVELDIGYLTILFLKKIKLAWDVKISEDHFTKRSS